MKTNVLINNGKSNDDIAKTHFASEKKEKAKERRTSSKEGLVYSVEESGLTFNGDLRLHTGRNSYETIQLIKDRIYDVCYHDGDIYFASGKCVYSVKKKGPIAERPGIICGLCSNDGKLYDVGKYDGLYSTEDDSKVQTIPGKFTANLCSHNGEVYSTHFEDSKCYITKPLKTTWMKISDLPVTAMYSHRGELYYATEGQLNKLGQENILRRPNQIFALCSWNGKLLDAGDYLDIYNSGTGKKAVETTHDVSAMCTVPKAFVEGILKK